MRSKKNLEFAHVYVMGVIEEVNRKEQEKIEAEIQLERVVKHIIESTAMELLGDEEDPEEILERYIQENGLDKKPNKKNRFNIDNDGTIF